MPSLRTPLWFRKNKPLTPNSCWNNPSNEIRWRSLPLCCRWPSPNRHSRVMPSRKSPRDQGIPEILEDRDIHEIRVLEEKHRLVPSRVLKSTGEHPRERARVASCRICAEEEISAVLRSVRFASGQLSVPSRLQKHPRKVSRRPHVVPMDATRISIFDAVRAIQSPSIRDGQDRIGANVVIPTGDVQQRQALAAEARSLA